VKSLQRAGNGPWAPYLYNVFMVKKPLPPFLRGIDFLFILIVIKHLQQFLSSKSYGCNDYRIYLVHTSFVFGKKVLIEGIE